jgi:hypothetical protein
MTKKLQEGGDGQEGIPPQVEAYREHDTRIEEQKTLIEELRSPSVHASAPSSLLSSTHPMEEPHFSKVFKTFTRSLYALKITSDHHRVYEESVFKSYFDAVLCVEQASRGRYALVISNWKLDPKTGCSDFPPMVRSKRNSNLCARLWKSVILDNVLESFQLNRI